jgi:hypothetical protein
MLPQQQHSESLTIVWTHLYILIYLSIYISIYSLTCLLSGGRNQVTPPLTIFTFRHNLLRVTPTPNLKTYFRLNSTTSYQLGFKITASRETPRQNSIYIYIYICISIYMYLVSPFLTSRVSCSILYFTIVIIIILLLLLYN